MTSSLEVMKSLREQFGKTSVSEGDIYLQIEGCPTGLRPSGQISRLVMDKWTELFLERMTQAEIEVHLLKKYVDDVNVCMAMVEEGWSWKKQEK